MKKVTLSICVLLMIACFTQVKAQSPEDMKKWEAYMAPSDVHKMLAKSDGEWKTDVTIWMAPGAPGDKMVGACVNTMILGGRYQQSKHTGDAGGMPFEGISTLAYDNTLKTFTTTWIDNMGTGMSVMKGTWDEATKSITFKGEETDPMSGKSIPVKEVFKMVDDNSHTLDAYKIGPDGKEYKSMAITFKRK